MYHYEREPVSPLRRRFIDDLHRRNKQPRTIETYVLRVVQFAKHFQRSPEVLGPREIDVYQKHLVQRQVSWSMFNQSVCALSFLYHVTLGRPGMIRHIPFAKRPHSLRKWPMRPNPHRPSLEKALATVSERRYNVSRAMTVLMEIPQSRSARFSPTRIYAAHSALTPLRDA